MKTPLLLLLAPLALYATDDGCESEPPEPEPIGLLHSEPGVCDGYIELQGYDGSTVDSGWGRIDGILDQAALIIIRDDCTDIEERCPAGTRLQGSVAVGQGECRNDSNGVSTSGINLDSGFMGLCSAGDLVWIIGHDDCGGLTDSCPTGFVPVGNFHVGSGGCDGFPSGKDWMDQPLDSGWLTLCAEEGHGAVVVVGSDC